MCQESFCLLRLYYIFIETYFITKNSFIVIPNWIWILQTTCLSQPNQKFSKKSIRHYNLLTEFWYGTQESHQTLALIADRNSFFELSLLSSVIACAFKRKYHTCMCSALYVTFFHWQFSFSSPVGYTKNKHICEYIWQRWWLRTNDWPALQLDKAPRHDKQWSFTWNNIWSWAQEWLTVSQT